MKPELERLALYQEAYLGSAELAQIMGLSNHGPLKAGPTAKDKPRSHA